jgi:hypothetical protein
MLKILEPNRKRASQGCCAAPLKNGSRFFNIPANGSHRADHHWRHRLARYFTRAVFPFVMVGTKKQVFGFPPKKPKMPAGRWCGGCRGEYEMAESLQTVVTASVHPRQPLSLIQDGADKVSHAQGSGLCSTLMDKKDEHVCSLLVQNSLF